MNNFSLSLDLQDNRISTSMSAESLNTNKKDLQEELHYLDLMRFRTTDWRMVENEV